MEAQILSAGPSLIFMVEIRWSSRKSSRACPSISCDRKWAASSSQPEHREVQSACKTTKVAYDLKINCDPARLPWSEEINLQTSSTLHWEGVADRKLAPSSGRLPGAELSDCGALWSARLEQEWEELGDSDGDSSSSSPSLEASSERLDSEWH